MFTLSLVLDSIFGLILKIRPNSGLILKIRPNAYAHLKNLCKLGHRPEFGLRTKSDLLYYIKWCSASTTISGASSLLCHIIPCRLGCRGLELPWLIPRPIQCWPIVHALLQWEERVESLSRCSWCAATAILCFQCVCVVCASYEGGGGEIEGLVPIILRAMPVCCVSLRPCTCTAQVPEPASCVISTLAHTRGPGALKPGSSGLSQI